MTTDYEVKLPTYRSKEKGYIDWIKDWSSWFYQPNPERNNDGDVVFLRSTPLAEGNYSNEAVVMIGNESLEISKDQLVLVPIITATFIADEDQTSQWLFGMARGDIKKGDNPPALTQLKINGEDIKIIKKAATNGNAEEVYPDFAEFEFETPIYTIHIPDAPPGVSLKHQVEYPVEASGYFPAVTRGYFVLLKLPKGEFYIHCEATGATTHNGPYNVSLFYRILVTEKPNRKGAAPPPDRLSRNIAVEVIKKLNNGQITNPEFEKIKAYIGEKKFVRPKVEHLLEELVEETKVIGKSVPHPPPPIE